MPVAEKFDGSRLGRRLDTHVADSLDRTLSSPRARGSPRIAVDEPGHDHVPVRATVKVGKDFHKLDAENKKWHVKSTAGPVDFDEEVYGWGSGPTAGRGETLVFQEKFRVASVHSATTDHKMPDHFQGDDQVGHGVRGASGRVVRPRALGISACDGLPRARRPGQHGRHRQVQPRVFRRGQGDRGAEEVGRQVQGQSARPVGGLRVPRCQVFKVLEEENKAGQLDSVSFQFAEDRLPVGWEVVETMQLNDKVSYRYMDVLTGRVVPHWPSEALLSEHTNRDEYKRTGRKFSSVPKIVRVEVRRPLVENEGNPEREQEYQPLVGTVEIPIKAWLIELEYLRYLYGKLKEDIVSALESQISKKKKGLHESMHKGEQHRELKREAEITKDVLVKALLKAHKDDGNVEDLWEAGLKEELEGLPLRAVRHRVLASGVDLPALLHEAQWDEESVVKLEKARKKKKKADKQLELLKTKIEAIERRLATPTWYKLSPPYDKEGYWDNGVFKGNPGDVRKGPDGEEWQQDSFGMNRHTEAFMNDPPCWVKLSIAVTVEQLGHDGAPVPCKEQAALRRTDRACAGGPKFEPKKTYHMDVPRTDRQERQVMEKDRRETKKSVVMRACCRRRGKEDGKGRLTTRRELMARTRPERQRQRHCVVRIEEGQRPGFRCQAKGELFVDKVDNDYQAKAQGVIVGMRLVAFSHGGEGKGGAGKPPFVFDEEVNEQSKKIEWKDVKKWVKKKWTTLPHEYHFSLEGLGDHQAALGKQPRRGVWVVGYGYTPLGDEKLDTVNAMRVQAGVGAVGGPRRLQQVPRRRARGDAEDAGGRALQGAGRRAGGAPGSRASPGRSPSLSLSPSSSPSRSRSRWTWIRCPRMPMSSWCRKALRRSIPSRSRSPSQSRSSVHTDSN